MQGTAGPGGRVDGDKRGGAPSEGRVRGRTGGVGLDGRAFRLRYG